MPSKPAGPERIQKVLAAAGYGSRRSCEELVLDGRVTINGKRLTELPILVAAHIDDIRVDGRPIRVQHHVYFMLHKPRGVISTNNDPQGRRRAIDLLPGVRERVFSVGRLDADSTGLILLTDDGELAHRLTHPRFEIPKTYRVTVGGPPVRDGVLRRLREGVRLDDGMTAPAQVRRLAPRELELTIREGRKRQVRRMCETVGHPVRELRRVRFGPLAIGTLKEGASRRLTPAEVDALRSASGMA